MRGSDRFPAPFLSLRFEIDRTLQYVANFLLDDHSGDFC
jgi:hypothetical protein